LHRLPQTLLLCLILPLPNLARYARSWAFMGVHDHGSCSEMCRSPWPSKVQPCHGSTEGCPAISRGAAATCRGEVAWQQPSIAATTSWLRRWFWDLWQKEWALAIIICSIFEYI
jgi:hypothetical protein